MLEEGGLLKKFSRRRKDECIDAMRASSVFGNCTDAVLSKMCSKMKKEKYTRGSYIYHQDEPQSDFSLVLKGSVRRDRLSKGQQHTLVTATHGDILGVFHVLKKDPAAASVKCLSDVSVFKMASDDYSNLLTQPEVAIEVVDCLNHEIRRQANLLHAPLLSQHPKPTPVLAISVAASIESFYRSALNASLNAKLTGQAAASLFPNMSLQVPSRILYINGFKGIRHVLDQNIDIDGDETPTSLRLGVAIAPGLLMSPISSVLEACNAGHMNPEPIQRRWIRGLIPRSVREVIFGVGLNQLSDYFEERVTFISNGAIRNAIASVMAGTVAGYFSHVPHNLSTMKLMEPHKSYAQHMHAFIKKSETRVPTSLAPSTRYALATVMALTFPRGLGIRTTQIVGSFVILNGTINSIKDFDPLNMIKDYLRQW